jgi:electron transport complex protein RnfG
MRDLIKMIVVITAIAAVSGGFLAGARDMTKANIEKNKLNFVQGPAIRKILEGASNDPVESRFKLKNKDGQEITFFVGVMDGKPKAVAFETFGRGFGGDIGVMFAVDITNDSLVGIGVTTHSETPGLGSRAKDDSFTKGWKGDAIAQDFKVKQEGGDVDAITGATVTSKGVCLAANAAKKIYKELEADIEKNAQSISIK